jgi:hypothetical protein
MPGQLLPELADVVAGDPVFTDSDQPDLIDAREGA